MLSPKQYLKKTYEYYRHAMRYAEMQAAQPVRWFIGYLRLLIALRLRLPEDVDDGDD